MNPPPTRPLTMPAPKTKSKVSPKIAQDAWKHLQATQEAFFKQKEKERTEQAEAQEKADFSQYSASELHELLVDAINDGSLSKARMLFEAGAMADWGDVIDADFEMMELALAHKVICKDPQSLFLYMLEETNVDVLETKLGLIHQYLPNMPVSQKVIRSLWYEKSLEQVAAWAKSGLPLLPEKWTPAYQKDFDGFLQVVAEMDEDNSMVDFKVLMETITPHFSATFQPLASYHGTLKSTKLWEQALLNTESEELILLFLKIGVLPTDRASRYFEFAQDTPLSWPLCMALSGEQTLFQFLLTDEKQRALFEEDVTQGRKFLFDRVDTESMSLFAYSFLFEPLEEMGFDFTKTNQDGNTFFHLWFEALGYCSDWDDAETKTALSPKAIQTLAKYASILLESKNEDEELCFEMGEFDGVYIKADKVEKKPKFLKKENLMIQIEQENLRNHVPTTTKQRGTMRL